MKPVIALALALAAMPVAATSPFDGRWVIDPTSTHVFDTAFDVTLANGHFACNWCSPAWKIPADGHFHPVAGQKGYDEAAVAIIDSHSAQFRRKRQGRETYAATDRVSEDGRHMVFAWVDRASDGSTETGTGHWIRRGKLTPGAHPVTGRWRELWTRATASSTGSFTISTTGRTMHMMLGPGQSFTAILDGPAVPMDGDNRATIFSLRRAGKRAFIQTERVNGAIVSVTRHILRDDGHMDIIMQHQPGRSQSRYTARRQAAGDAQHN